MAKIKLITENQLIEYALRYLHDNGQPETVDHILKVSKGDSSIQEAKYIGSFIIDLIHKYEVLNRPQTLGKESNPYLKGT